MRTPTGEALDRLVRLAARALRAPVAYLSLVDGEQQSIRNVVGLEGSFAPGRNLPLSQFLTDRVLSASGPVVIADLHVDAGERALDLERVVEGAAALLAIPLRLDSGKPVAVLGVIDRKPRAWAAEEVEILRDLADTTLSEIRARGKSEGLRGTSEALRESEERFRSLIENSSDLVTIVSAGGTIDYATPSAERVLGYAPESLVGQNAFTLLHPSDAPTVIGRFARLVRGGVCDAAVDCRVRHRDGSWRTLEIRVNNLLHDSAVVGVVVNAHDITEAREATDTQRRLQAFLEATPDFVATFDPHGRALSVNAAFRHAASVSETDDLSGLTLPDLFPPAVTERILHEGIPTATRKGIWSAETYLTTADGTIIPISQVILAHRAADGSLEFLSTLGRDIRDQKAAEEGIRRTAELLREAERIAHVGSWDWDLVTGDLTWSDELYRVYGLDPATEQVTYDRFVSLIHPDDRSMFREIGERARGQHESFALDFRVIRPDGQVRHLHGRGRVLTDGAGKAIRMTGSGQDVTERKAAEEALRQSEQDYRGLFEHAHDGIVIMMPDGEIVLDVNPAACEMYGYSREEFVGMSMEAVSQDVAAGRRKVLETLEANSSWSFELVQKRKDGSPIWVEITAAVVDYKGRQAILSVIRDISERHATEAALRESQEQLLQSQKMDAVGRLAGGIAHDFNNLLTAIKGFTELLLLDLEPGDPRQPFVAEIQGAANRAAALTRQLLAFSRKQVLQPRVLDLNATVGDIEQMLRRLLGEDVQLEAIQAPNLGRVKADPSQIEQVLVNLAVNARDAMPGGGRIRIRTKNQDVAGSSAGAYVMLSVTDTGAGMTPEVQARIFEPFFTTKEKGKGTGLGLSTVYGIVQQSGGFVQVESTVGEGTTFNVFLPRVQEEAEIAADRKAPTRPATGSETVLLVEDEAAVRVLVRRVLDRNGYRVLEADCGARALELLEINSEPIHLLLTDVVMPGMSGRELADRLAPRFPDMRILYMSGYTDEAIVHHGVLDSGIALLEKPFTPDALLQRLREVLDGSASVMAR